MTFFADYKAARAAADQKDAVLRFHSDKRLFSVAIEPGADERFEKKVKEVIARYGEALEKMPEF